MRGWNTSRSLRLRVAAAAVFMLPAGFALRGLAQHIETSTFNSSPLRPKEDPKAVARGKKAYEANCQSCHAADLRGGPGPSILRSQGALTDKNGENITAIIQGQDKMFPNHKYAISNDDSAAVAAFIRSNLALIGSQGRAPGDGTQKLNVVVGNAEHGKQYFEAKCASCHSAEGDLKGYAKKVSDPKTMQAAWLRGNHLGVPQPTIKVTVTQTGAKPVEGTLIHVDDFLVTLQLPDGSVKTIRRNGDIPKVVVKDPLEAHRNLWPVLADNDIHDITAYLVTLK
ncbi:cytochrome c, mono- and diheme variants family [Terriglobus roseus DSM 18391]|uniref:Cytochrome c, mono-and diheme variants family n=1 Tax=Terriglobus roseus (strain DSM 18391 / NRRL B-41598 / KBS 63) TaxID=926566 RepID=I3ZIM7_TERRK|nr:cytochrome c [Terriglobus roseus]AFL89095.1 cytochrome c, mono- and diheme variants family [Terriglobus roseus DSM 18391]